MKKPENASLLLRLHPPKTEKKPYILTSAEDVPLEKLRKKTTIGRLFEVITSYEESNSILRVMLQLLSQNGNATLQDPVSVQTYPDLESFVFHVPMLKPIERYPNQVGFFLNVNRECDLDFLYSIVVKTGVIFNPASSVFQLEFIPEDREKLDQEFFEEMPWEAYRQQKR